MIRLKIIDYVCYITSCTLPELRLRYLDTARAGCQVGTIVWSLSNIRPHNPNKHTSWHALIFGNFWNKLKYSGMVAHIWKYLEYFDSCNIPSSHARSTYIWIFSKISIPNNLECDIWYIKIFYHVDFVINLLLAL